MDLSPAPGRFPFHLTPRWTAVVLLPVPGFVAVGLFCDGEIVEVIDEPLDALGYVEALAKLETGRARSGSHDPRESAAEP